MHHEADMVPGTWVHIGFWLNWSKHPLSIATVTTPLTVGLIVVSIMALFIRIVGGHFWGILCYFIHQFRSSPGPKDGLFHQEQVLLRNSSSDTATFWEFAKLGWYWRSRAHKSKARVFFFASLALFDILLFGAAAVLSNRIYSTSSEIRIVSDNCGNLNTPEKPISEFNDTDWTTIAALFVEQTAQASWSLNYARNCYSGIKSSQCNEFAVRQLPTRWVPGSCPFADELCVDPVNGVITFYTDKINTDTHLGINSRQEFSVDYEQITTCAPLNITAFQTNNDTAQEVNLGTSKWNGNLRPYTVQYVYPVIGQNIPAYTLYESSAYLNGPEYSDFSPVPQLNQTGGDIFVFTLINNALYSQQVDDIWFNATKELNTTGSGWAPTSYENANFTSVMGCSMWHRFSGGNTSTPFTGLYEVGNLSPFTGQQAVIAHYLWDAVSNSDFGSMGAFLGTSALNANLFLEFADSRFSTPPQGSPGLPAWATEVYSWHNWTMAQLQRSIVSTATGPIDPVAKNLITPIPDDTSNSFDICKNTKLRNSGFYSFSIVGLLVAIVVGLAIIITNLSLPLLVEQFRRIFKIGEHKQADWTQDHLLHIQRIAFEKDGILTWEGREKSVPTTMTKEVFHSPRHSLSSASGHAFYSPVMESPATMDSSETTEFPGFTRYKTRSTVMSGELV